jgi:hypothetical protein
MSNLISNDLCWIGHHPNRLLKNDFASCLITSAAFSPRCPPYRSDESLRHPKSTAIEFSAAAKRLRSSRGVRKVLPADMYLRRKAALLSLSRSQIDLQQSRGRQASRNNSETGRLRPFTEMERPLVSDQASTEFSVTVSAFGVAAEQPLTSLAAGRGKR